LAEESVIVVEEIADHLAERFQQEREQRGQLLAAEVRTLRTAFEKSDGCHQPRRHRQGDRFAEPELATGELR
jgi:hypothetical protein